MSSRKRLGFPVSTKISQVRTTELEKGGQPLPERLLISEIEYVLLLCPYWSCTTMGTCTSVSEIETGSTV
jgi:hypothetical protein